MIKFLLSRGEDKFITKKLPKEKKNHLQRIINIITHQGDNKL